MDNNVHTRITPERMFELKPCPFCGGKAKICPAGPGFRVECLLEKGACAALPVTWDYDTEKEAAEAWNRRYNDQSEKTYTKFVDNSSIPLKRFKDLNRGETFIRVSDLMMKTDDDTAVNLNYGYILHNIGPDDVVRPALTTITIEK